ncbi:hypothetical protein [Gloeocapsa sp. PCC 73106]|uniref:DUF7734 family protein n=1 Tax=Gloeocapsa sp. PCC 73106 TaxID=102232 RepID=UPI0002ABFF38|nr:hypothetical protein [Gloeocapsa sp. PCC 73106]ELR99439.1 hypothetical protein GLO73106DRAFT_00032900 [Gloeocapsa sp. PCC 73106]
MFNSPGQKLEQYSSKHPEEVLIVTIDREGMSEQIIIYKGFSSSLTNSTAFDPEIPLIPPEAKIIKIDRVKSPYQPDSPKYLQQDVSWQEMTELF